LAQPHLPIEIRIEKNYPQSIGEPLFYLGQDDDDDAAAAGGGGGAGEPLDLA